MRLCKCKNAFVHYLAVNAIAWRGRASSLTTAVVQRFFTATHISISITSVFWS
jgi:hypothetical protein